MTISDFIYRFAFHGELFGLAATLSLICALQYGMYLYYKYRREDREEGLIAELKKLEGELTSAHRERRQMKVENGLLAELFAQTDPARTVEVLLKKFIPHTSTGFGAFFTYDGRGLDMYAQRGLCRQTLDQLIFDQPWPDRVLQERVCRITDAELYNSQFVRCLSIDERRKISELHLLGVTDQHGTFGVIAVTELFPRDAELQHQQEAAERMLDQVTGLLRHRMNAVDQQQLLKLTQEKLALRTIADRYYDVPTRLLDDFVKRLTSLVEADRGALILYSVGNERHPRAICRQGTGLQMGVEGVWRNHELKIARWTRANGMTGCLTPGQLKEAGVNNLLGRALAVPLYQNNKLIAMLCLTRKDEGVFSRMQVSLANWAGEFLAEALLRVVDRVSVERKASLDGLTELANRRTFDQRIVKELETARRSGNECSLLLLDLDHFKSINDRYGHPAGDEVLRQFARLLESESQKVRSTDCPLVARYGGEEMAILLPGVGVQGASRIAESIRFATSRMVVLYQSERILISVSIGLACFPRQAMTVGSLIEAADDALYQAKHEGRNTVRIAASTNPREAAVSV